jgi:stage V sporulation protein AF
MSLTAETGVSISQNYQENVDYLNSKLGVPDSFDIVLREMTVGGKKLAIYSVNGMVSRPASNIILDTFVEMEKTDLVVNALDKLVKSKIVDLQVSEVEAMDEVIYFLLSGTMVILWKAKIRPLSRRPHLSRRQPKTRRGKSHPGFQDGFTETLLFNTILIRGV